MVVKTLVNIGAPFKVHHVALFLKKFANEFFVLGLRVLEDFLGARQNIFAGRIGLVARHSLDDSALDS